MVPFATLRMRSRRSRRPLESCARRNWVRRPPKRASRSVAISSGSAKPAHCSCSTRSRAICRLCLPWLKPGPIAMPTQCLFSGAGRKMVEPRAAGYDESLSCSNARNELVQEINAAFPKFAEKPSYATWSHRRRFKIPLCRQTFITIGCHAVFGRDTLEGNLARRGAHDVQPPQWGVPCPLNQYDWSED